MPRPTLSRRIELLEDRTTPAVAFALQSNALVAFDTANPAAALPAATITGLVAGDNLVGIDVRPQNGMLYGLGYNSGAATVQLYAISTRTAVATAIGTPIPGAAGSNYGFDFNPTVDRIRVVTDAGQNYRIDPNTGALAMADTNINGAVGSLDASAYTNNAPNATVTTLYGLDASTDQLVIQNPPNGGVTTAPVAVTLNGSPLNFTAANGFDIPTGVNAATSNSPATGSAFAALTVGGSTHLYSIDLTSGAATDLGTIGTGGAAVQGFAISNDLPPPEGTTITQGVLPGIGLSADGSLLLRSTGGPVTAVGVTGVGAGDTLVGIDFRPATGQLYGFGVNPVTGSGTLYRIDPQTGAATNLGAVGSIALPTPLPAASVGYGVDFNPVADKLRVVTGTGLNFRVNPDGTLFASDTNLNGGATSATAAAYTNSFGGATVTTLYTLDSTSHTLSIQNPPNAGTESMTRPVTLNGSPLLFTSINGFDIPAGVTVAAANGVASGNGVAVLTVNGVSSAYAINLSTGAATLLLGAQPVSGFTVGDAPAGAVSFSTPPGSTTRFVGGTTANVILTRTGGSVGALTVTVSAVGGTAVAGVDYTGLPTSVTFADGQVSTVVSFVIPAGAAAGTAGQTLVLGLSNPTNGGVLGAGTTIPVTIAARVAPTAQYAVGQDTGGGVVTVYNPDNSVKFSTSPFGAFSGGVRTAMADVNGDGVADLIIGTGPGVPNRVRVLSGVDQSELAAFSPFESTFTGGVFVAGGDVNGDGIAEVVVTPDQSGGPRVVVYQGGTFAQIASFFGIDDANFRGGARAAVADVNGDGYGDLIVSAGFGGGPRVAIFSGVTVTGSAQPVKLLPDFFAFEDTLRNGVYVAGGDVNGDGYADIITGGGPGGGPRVQIIDGLVALNNGSINVVPTANPSNVVLANFFAGDPNNRGGIRVTAKDLDGDVYADVVTGSGEGAGSQVTGYLGTNLRTGNATQSFAFPAFPGFAGGVFVG